MPIGLKGNSDGSGAIQIGGSDAISISTGLNTTFAGTITATGTVAGTTGTLYPLVSDTARTATGTAIDFTGIPSWVKRVTVMLRGVSTNGTSNLLIQIGTSSGFENTGYTSGHAYITSASAAVGTTQYTTGFGLTFQIAAASVIDSVYVLTNQTGNVWTGMGTMVYTTSGSTGFGSGSKTAVATLDRVRITTVNGTDTFDAGTINLLWE